MRQEKKKATPEQSINRNIVECKLRKIKKRNGDGYCINRNIVECKF